MKKVIFFVFFIISLNLNGIVVSEINIIGNTYTKEKTILQYLYFHKNIYYEEDKFNYYKNLSLQFLKDTDFFEKVKIKCEYIGENVIVNIYVKEGVLWKTGANLHSVMLGRNNLLGRGYNLRIRVGEEQSLALGKVYVSGFSVKFDHKKITKRFENEDGFWEDYNYNILQSSLSYLLRLNEYYALKGSFIHNSNFFKDGIPDLISGISSHPFNNENLFIPEFIIDTRDSKLTPMKGFFVDIGDKLLCPYKKNIYFLDSYNYLKINKKQYFMFHISGKTIDKKIPQYYWQNLDSIFLYHFFNINKKLYKSYLGINIEPRWRWYENKYYFLENKLFYDFCYSSEIIEKDKIYYTAAGAGIKLHTKKYFVTDFSVDISYCNQEFSPYWKIGKRW